MNKNFQIHKKYIYFCIVAVVFLGALFASYTYGALVQRDKYADFLKSFKNIREDSDKYTFINPLIGGISAPATDVGVYSEIKSEIVSYLAQQKVAGELYDYSFYYRDFGTGFWFGSNESSNFFPASLFKLPIALAVYKEGEDNPSFLKKTIVYSEEIANINKSIQTNSVSVLEIGKSYSVEDLVAKMLTESDNGAKNLLLVLLDKSYLNQLFSIISFVNPSVTETYSISSGKYALFFRMLYGSSYLNEEHSELVLSLLSKSTFREGLVAGFPSTIPVAHKFGVYEFQDTVNGITEKVHQLHDCGIVYHAERPYAFCLMTKGKDIPELYKIISHVSKLVYDNQEQDK